jgi:TrmH family RNA methyltransferase
MSSPLVSVVLVRPRYVENIGAIARVMENVSAAELIIVAPNAITLDSVAARVAKGGEPRLQTARFERSLKTALADFDLTLATSYKTGRRRRAHTPWEVTSELVPRTRPRTIALVMGPEDVGLNSRDVAQCHHLVAIPTSGPLNLAQATAILLYELCLRPTSARIPPGRHTHPIDSSMVVSVPEEDNVTLARLNKVASDALAQTGYPPHRKALQHEVARLVSLIARADPAPHEVNFIMGMFKHLERWAKDHQ